MDEARAKSNLCRIFHRQSDGDKKVFGCGCLVKCSDQTLKIATSKKVRKLMETDETDGEVFATFETLPDKEVKLQVDREEEGEDRGIAYVSFDEAAFRHRPEGISMARDIRGIEEIACRVPVLENLELLGRPTSEIKLYDVERDHTRCTLKFQAGRNNRVISNLSESDKFHLLVRGAPILDADNFEFFGIVDFVEMDEDSLLELVYHRGFPMASTAIRNQPIIHPSTPTHERVPQRPTAEAEVNIRCIFCGPSSWLSTSAQLAFKYSGNKLQDLKDLVQEFVLPCGAHVRDVIFGSVTFVVVVTHLGALEEIWKRYKEGKMKQVFAEKIFEISAQDQPGLDLTVEMSEDEYTKAKEQLTIPSNIVDPSETVSTSELQTINKSMSHESIKSNIRISTALPGSPTPPTGPSRDIQQETTDGGRNCLSPDDDLRSLWEYIDFQDAFSSVLDVKYARSKYWLHLAEQFGIKQDIYDGFSTSDINSPTETLLKYLEATKPTYSVKEFCEDCKEVDAYEVSRILEDSVKDGILDNEDLVSEICDKADTKAPYVLDEVVLKLDRENRLWQNLARMRKIPRKKYMAFQRDTTTNPARLFFNALRTQGPEITVGDLKEKENQLKVEMISHILKKFKIPDEMLLKDLPRDSPDATSEIELSLNDLTTDFLWNLASLYQKGGLMKDIDLQLEFRQQENVHSPTKEVMKYVLASSPQRLTIKDLIVKLWNVNRKDCFDILLPYLRGGKKDIDKITEMLKRLQVEPSEGRGLTPSTGDERSSSIPASDESDEIDNQYTAFQQTLPRDNQ